MTQSLADFQAAILADGIIDEAEVNQIRERVYADGIIDREEADFLFALNDAASDQDNHASWTTLFVDAICDHVLKDETSPGTVDDDEAAYLISKIQADGKVDSTELALLVELCDRATGEAPASLNAFILANVKAAVLDDGIIDAAEVELLRKVVYGAGGADGAGVDRSEADLLFDLNDATTGQANDPSWPALFVDAICDHVLKDETSPGTVDDDEAAYLISKIQADGTVDSTELTLLVELCNRATGEAPASLNAFILANVKDAVLDDGIIDAAEVELLSKVIYGAGGSSGAYVDRAEADLLFDLNDATTGKANDASWKDLFVAAITSHVLGDDASPDAVDADEAAWLIARIEGDDVYDDNEKALLRNIKAKAASLDGKLAFKIGMFT